MTIEKFIVVVFLEDGTAREVFMNENEYNLLFSCMNMIYENRGTLQVGEEPLPLTLKDKE